MEESRVGPGGSESGARMNAVERIRSLSCWRSPPKIRPIEQGRTNQNYIAEDGEQTFFARLGVDLPHHGISRANEVRCCKLAAVLGLAPKVFFAAEGVLITEFIDGRTLCQGAAVSKALLDSLAQSLRRLHEAPVPEDLAPFDPADICRRQLDALPDASVSPARRRKVVDILQRAPELEARSLIHADLIPENVILRGDALFLVDWEYAGLGDPMVDLAMVAVHFRLVEPQVQGFLANYGATDREAVIRLIPVIAAREALWCATQIHFVGLAGDLESYTKACWDQIEARP